MAHSGKLIVFEGPDGVGKSTLANAFHKHLDTRGIPNKLLSFPGRERGTLGRHVYEIHHSPAKFGISNIDPTSLQVLHIAAHLDAIESRIRPFLRLGRWVVLDRFWWSTWAYGLVYGVPRSSLHAMIDLELVHWREIQPDAVIVVMRRRPIGREHSGSLHASISTAYDTLVREQRETFRVHIIENEGRPQRAVERIAESLADLLSDPVVGWMVQRSIEEPNETGHRAARGGRSGQTPLDLEEKHALGLAASRSRFGLAVPSEVYETYWRFAAERQEIFFKRLEGQPPPWTDDPILRRYKFTNAYRVSDRVSQYLIRNVIYTGDQSSEEIFFRTILFKLFNSIPTWELLKREIGEVHWSEYSFERYDAILSRALESRQAIYSSAYIMPPVSQFGQIRKHGNHLKLLERMMFDEVPLRIADAPSMREVFNVLRSYPGLGDFLAFQFAVDLNYSEVLNFSEMDFVVPGPGARDGIAKCFRSLDELGEDGVIRWMAEKQEDEFARFGVKFRSLWGRRLQLVDCQNLFCEVSKYARLAHPQVKGRSDRTRIKRLYEPNHDQIQYWYPPKWSLSEVIGKWEYQ